ncbi:GlxA family transcriptional regulator [Arthrobacter sp. KNU-44]|uniref:GlxA family transcriptional regulator n=1 Tax=Arthrobacter sp. KNU-44 TaxID=3450744 RepID=UPI003F41E602
MAVVTFLLVPDVHLLDLAGPAQVFSTAADLGFDYKLAYVAEQAEVVTAQGLPLRAATSFPELTTDDLLVVPGWRAPTLGFRGRLGTAMLEGLRIHHQRGGTVVSICAGVDALGWAGLLDGRRCTTHHELQAELAVRYPKASVIRDVLYVHDGGILTSAGIASGIDLALHLIAVRHGPAAAARIARHMVIYARRNGHEQQESVMLRHRGHLDDVVHRVQDRIDSDFTKQLQLRELSRVAKVSERTLTRTFKIATGLTPLRYQQSLRLEHAEHLLSHGTTMENAARAVGFEDARALRRLRSVRN